MYSSGFPVRISGELHHVLLRFDWARSGRLVGSKTVSGWARSGLFRVDFSGFRFFPDHVARSNFNGLKSFSVDRANQLNSKTNVSLLFLIVFLFYWRHTKLEEDFRWKLEYWAISYIIFSDFSCRIGIHNKKNGIWLWKILKNPFFSFLPQKWGRPGIFATWFRKIVPTNLKKDFIRVW